METPRLDPYAAWRHRDYRLFAGGSILAAMGGQMQTLAVGWQLYERTGSAMALGWVGFVQVVPVLLLALPAGHLADRADRRLIVLYTTVLTGLCSFGLAWLSVVHGSIAWIYFLLFLTGVARALGGPARASLLPQIVPLDVFPNAVTWNSSGFHMASVLGPALGGLVIAFHHQATLVYLIDGLACAAFMACLFQVKGRQVPFVREQVTLQSMLAGVRFVWTTKSLLAAMTLDMFAVLLGGATTLLPIFAKDILHVGPGGLGWLRAALPLGAFAMGLWIAHAPPFRHAGRALMWAVAGFGIATIVFGFSKWFWLSMAMLFLTGALDNISVVIRHTLVQVLTPDAMRGRVSAVNNIFIGSSNELGGFESGVVAAWFGAVTSVVFGGIGTVAVVLIVAAVWPQILRLRSLKAVDATREEEESEGVAGSK